MLHGNGWILNCLSEKDLGRMHFEVFLSWAVDLVLRDPHFRAFELVISAAVVVLFVEEAADFEAEFGGDGDEAAVEELVDVGAEEEAVGYFVDAAMGEGDDVGGVKGGEGVLVGHRALLVDGLEDVAEASLTQAGFDDRLLTISGALLHDAEIEAGRLRKWERFGPFEARLPEAVPFTARKIVALATDDVLAPIARRIEPQVARKEHG